jgi:hypothetical protein
VLTTTQREQLLAQVASAAAPLSEHALGRRWPWDHDELEQRCEQLAAALARSGADEVALKTYPWGPEQRYFGWTGDRVPLVEEAELWLIDGDGDEQLLCRASDDPGCCLGALRPTEGLDGELFELVDAGFGSLAGEYRRHRVGGKLVLASGHQANAAMHEALVARDAAGLLLGPGAALEARPRRFTGPCLYAPQRPFGFNLDARRYHLLLSTLAAGESPRLRVVTRIRSEAGQRPAVLARLRGAEQDDQRVCLAVDLARDPGSVVGAMRALTALKGAIVSGVLSPPMRGIELCLLGGDAAAVAWLADPETAPPTALLQLTLDAYAQSPVVRPLRPSPTTFVDDLLSDELAATETLRQPYLDAPPAPRTQRQTQTRAPLALDGATPHAAWLHAPDHDHARWLTATAATLYELANLTVDQLPVLISRAELAASGRLQAKATVLRRRALDELDGEAAQRRAQACDQLWQIERALGAEVDRERRRLDSAAQFFGGAGADMLTLVEAGASLGRQRDRLTRVLTDELRAMVGPEAKLAVKRRSLSAVERRAKVTFYTLREIAGGQLAAGPLPLRLLLRNTRPADQSWLVHHERKLGAGCDAEAALQALSDAGGRASLLELWELLRDDDPALDLKLFGRLLEVLEGAELVVASSS